jgi:hypothetical protein
MDDFLTAVNGRQGVKVIIDGEDFFIARCRLLAHLQLSEIEIKTKAASEPVLISALIIEYLSVAGLTDKQIKKASTYEILDAFFALRQLNAWQWLLPWLANSTETGPAQPEFYDYSGRRWAVWVHRLASRYGWSKDEIFNLWPEEAAAYIQEIMVSEYYEREDRVYSWMVDERPPAAVRTPVRFLPVGNVVSMEDGE